MTFFNVLSWDGNGLNQPQGDFGGSHVGEEIDSVRSGKTQSVTACHRLIAFFVQTEFMKLLTAVYLIAARARIHWAAAIKHLQKLPQPHHRHARPQLPH